MYPGNLPMKWKEVVVVYAFVYDIAKLYLLKYTSA